MWYINQTKKNKESTYSVEELRYTIHRWKANTIHIRSSWGSWGCLSWRKRDLGGTLSLSTTDWKEVVDRRGLVSFPRQVTGQEDAVSSSSREGSVWTLKRISSLKGHWNRVPREGWSDIPGSIQEMTGGGTWYYSLFDKVVFKGWTW